MNASYSAAARHLHWLVVLLVGAQFAVTLLMPDVEEGMTLPQPVLELHFSLGLLVVLVMVVRLVVRLRHPVEPSFTPGRPLERLAVTATHRLFYLLLLGVPFLGWIAASAHGLPVQFLGLVTLPALVPDHTHWGHVAGDLHGLAMWTLLALVGLHAAAALFHHLIRRDDTLRRMLPGSH